ncbi:hypothetical protein ACOSQ3_008169 [Xanthoceras sorbifolium]
MVSPGYTSCALKIDTQTGWHKSLIKMLTNIDGQNPRIHNEVTFNNGYGYLNSNDINGYNNPYYSTGYGNLYNQKPEFHLFAPYYEPSAPPVATIPFYEPEPKYFPQPPPQHEHDFNVGNAQWCSIM